MIEGGREGGERGREGGKEGKDGGREGYMERRRERVWAGVVIKGGREGRKE